MVQRTRRGWRTALALTFCLFVGACVTLTGVRMGRRDRGIQFSHALHAKEEMDCTDCHDMAPDGLAMPDHDLCGLCHDIDVDAMDVKECSQCHTDPEQTVLMREKRLPEEVKFGHEAHLAKEIACQKCHPKPDSPALAKRGVKRFCMDCHAQTGAEMNECSVCHTAISKDTLPTHRGKARIPHDSPQIWARVHGQESKFDPAFCTLCHEDKSSCESCHRSNPPDSHTVAWRRKGHGLRATWDRRKCATCHEEDSCLKCHQNTRPSSHRRSWARPLNRHCVTCHYPPQRTGCTVCHESVEHPTALPSPHAIGVFPARCGLCHPGGRPYRAPHLLNSTARCVVCH
ncbi:MAG: hypothetical protein GWP08_07815 [Nitrospiraceae bacterium]|nr:hypothetical protein [Nitrospiraceae bacterium]